MEDKGMERRACSRFEIPGATVSYKEKKLFFSKKEITEEYTPVLDLSRGGLRFLGQELLKNKRRVSLIISIPDEGIPLSLKGRVLWTSFNPGKSYKYQIGIQFDPYGEKKEQNSPEDLAKLITLEQKFSPEQEANK
jgi:hypothetical protein